MYHRSIQTLSLAFLGLGVLLVVTTLANGGGPASVGIFLGLAFLAVGFARLWLSGVFRGWRGAGFPSRRGRGALPRDRTRGRHLP
ncbi:MAG TPA: hypothetical protein VHQ43_02440 [Solirubrobacterales bacterium]|nr:hypothetical protein [Solirubrobacterales bacterium]